MRISDWSSDVCSSDLPSADDDAADRPGRAGREDPRTGPEDERGGRALAWPVGRDAECGAGRSEEHTSELQSLMRISYAVFCLKKKNKKNHYRQRQNTTIEARKRNRNS